MLNDLDSRVLAHLQQSGARWQPKPLAQVLLAKADHTGASLRRLTEQKLVTREPLPGHNQNAYYCSVEQGAKAATDNAEATLNKSLYKTARVSWSPAERSLVLQEIHRLLKETRGYSFRQALYEAQNVLPITRRRAKLNAHTVASLRKQYDDMPKPDTQAPPPMVEAAEATPFDETPMAANDNDPEPLEVAEPTDPLGEILQRLIDAITTHIADQLIDTLSARLNQSLSRLNVTPPIVTPPPPPPTPKMRFVVAGLKGTQKTEIQSAMPKTAQVSFWGVDESPHQLKAICRDADRIFMMTKFVSHSHENMIRSIASDRLVRVNGGVTTLREQMQQSCRM